MRGLLAIFGCVLALAACSSNLQPLPTTDNSSYLLDSGDQLHIIVYNEDSLSTDYLVGDNGTVSFPMVGELKARGLTVDQFRQELYDALRKGIFVNPGISVEVSQYRPFYVVGEVSKPGQYPYAAGLNVLTAVAVAGGFTVRADTDQMTVVRTARGKSAEWSAGRLTELRPGDVVVVRERFF